MLIFEKFEYVKMNGNETCVEMDKSLFVIKIECVANVMLPKLVYCLKKKN